MSTFTVYDADGHVVEPWDMWVDYLDPAFRTIAPTNVVDNIGRPRRVVAGELMPPSVHILETEAEQHEERAGGHDPKARLLDMDAEGIERSIIFPSLGLRFGGLSDPVATDALCRAYNNWLSDYCDADRNRLVGVALLPQQDARLAVAEAHRSVEKLGFKAVMLRPNPINGRNLDHPSYEPLWNELEELGVPAAFHEGTTQNIVQSGADRFQNFAFRHTCSHPHEQQFALLSLIGGGVLERHPKLKAVFLESGVGWLPYWLERMDQNTADWGYATLRLPMRPSEYFARQCFITCEQREGLLPAVVDLLGDDFVMFASDYPHPDGVFPGAVTLLSDRTDLSDKTKTKLLATNATRCFNF
jgi:predicted TIM-barrel fold metal-dependent hydrolase